MQLELIKEGLDEVYNRVQVYLKKMKDVTPRISSVIYTQFYNVKVFDKKLY